jgi:hypothetical protein
MKEQMGLQVYLYSFFNLDSRRGWVVNAALWPYILLKKLWYPLCRRMCGIRGRSGRARKTSPPPGFDPQTFQPVASGCAGYEILAVLESYAVQEEILLGLLDP